MSTVKRRLARLEAAAELPVAERRRSALQREVDALSDGGLFLLLYAPDDDGAGELRPWDEWLVSLCDQVPVEQRKDAEASVAAILRWDSLAAVQAVGAVMPREYWRGRFLTVRTSTRHSPQ